MNNENKQELINLLLEYPEAATEIILRQQEFEAKLVEKLFERLKSIANKLKLEFRYCEDFFAKSPHSYFSFYKTQWNGLEIYFQFNNRDWKSMFVGVADKVHYDKDQDQNQTHRHLNYFNRKPEYCWTYGWDWIDEPYVHWKISRIVEILKNPYIRKMRGLLGLPQVMLLVPKTSYKSGRRTFKSLI